MSISDEELNSITRAIYTRYGIDFTNYETNSLKRRVVRIINQFELENTLGLWRKIIYEKDFIEVFINEVTVGLTEMFRNQDFWIKVKEDLLPKLNNKSNISIWHAGCATGEEVYSMAICLTEENMIKKCSVVSTDINSNFIKQAKEGCFSSLYKTLYTKNYISSKGKYNLKDYYEEIEESLLFNKLDLSRFSFKTHNLLKQSMNVPYDLILCRNVMIYFDDSLKMRILEEFYNSMNDDAFFAIGYYDSLPDEAKKFFKPYNPSCKIYLKR